MTATAMFETMFLCLFVGLAIYGGWQSLKSNHIFMKRPSRKRSGSIAGGSMTNPRSVKGPRGKIRFVDFMIGAAVANFAAVCTGFFDPEFSLRFFGLSLFVFVLGQASTLFFIDESYANFPELKYVLKAWCRCLFTASLLITIIAAIPYQNRVSFNFLGTFFLACIVCGYAFTLMTAAVVTVTMGFINNYMWTLKRKRIFALVLAELLLIVNTIIVKLNVQLPLPWYTIWPPYAISLGAGLWYFKPEPLYKLVPYFAGNDDDPEEADYDEVK